MSFRIAPRIQKLPNYPFVAIEAEVRRLRAQGRDIVRIDMGSPDLPPPPHVIEQLSHSARQVNKHGYSGYRGIPEFRQAIARYYKRIFNVELDPDKEVLPVIGSKEGLMNLTLALAGPGDVVLCPSPAYPTYEAAAIMSEAEPYIMPLTQENNFLPDLDAIPEEVARRARILWVNYPNNPTGALAHLEDYQRMLAFCQKYNILLGSDNPYFAIIFNGSKPISALQVPGAKEHTVEFMSLSKSHNMAGWRLGAAVGNPQAIEALLTVKSNMDSGHFTPVYEAGICALDETPAEWSEQLTATYKRRLQYFIDAADEIGLELTSIPKGAVYVWAKVKDGDDKAYAHDALHEAGISLVAGSIYGEAGKGYVRISLMLQENRLPEVIDRLKQWAKNRK